MIDHVASGNDFKNTDLVVMEDVLLIQWKVLTISTLKLWVKVMLLIKKEKNYGTPERGKNNFSLQYFASMDF